MTDKLTHTVEKGITYVISDTKECGKHISLSHLHRHPTWQEIKDAKMRFFPETMMAIYGPPPEDYINRHENCIHWYEDGPFKAEDRKAEVTEHAEKHIEVSGEPENDGLQLANSFNVGMNIKHENMVGLQFFDEHDANLGRFAISASGLQQLNQTIIQTVQNTSGVTQ